MDTTRTDPSSLSEQSPMADATPALADSDRLIDRAELASRLGVDVRTVSRMVRRGELPPPCLGQGGRPRWLWSYVIEFCRQRHARQEQLERRGRSKLT